MVNIIDLLKGQLGSAAINKVAELIGENPSNTSSAMNTIIPSLLGGLVQKGATQDGASSILDMLNNDKHDGGMFNNLLGLLGNGSKTSALMKAGSIALPFILGGKKAGITSLITQMTGLGSKSSSSLMSLIAPMVLGMIGKQVKSKGMGLSGLMELLSGQKEHVADALPAEMSSLLGFGNTNNSSSSSHTSTSKPASTGGGSSPMKWLLPLLVLAGLGYFLSKNSCAGDINNTTTNAVDTTTEVVDNAANTATNAANTATEAVTYTVDAAGNLVDASGNIIKKAGEFTKDTSGKILDASGNAVQQIENKIGEVTTSGGEAIENAANAAGDVAELSVDDLGNLVNKSGEIVYKVGDFKVVDGFYVDKDGNKIGKVWQKIKDAVSNAAGKTADFFENTFGGMFNKTEGAASNFTLSQLAFDPESSRITSFSKPEFEGLAAALKANPDAKIKVNVFTADGKNGIENKKLSTLRATQLTTMLVALGVKKSQITLKGMGNSDAAKAAANAIEITAN